MGCSSEVKTTFNDVTPTMLRQEWAMAGHYPDRDLFTIFAEQARRQPELAAVIDDTGTVSYGRLLNIVGRVATELSARGVQPGDIVGVQLPNGWMSVALDLAIAAVGAVCLPYPVHFRDQETRLLLGGSGASSVVAVDEFGGHDHLAMLRSLRGELPSLQTVFTVGPATSGALSLAEALTPGDSTWKPQPISPDNAARVIATSGTEAAPKMLLYSHNAIGGPLATVAGQLRPAPGWRMLLLAPLPTALGALGIYGVVAGHGGTLVVTSSFTPERALDLIAKHRVTHAIGVPTVFQMMTAHPRFDHFDTSAVEVIVTGGAAASPTTIEEIQRHFSCAYATMYGSSDGSFSLTRFDDAPERVLSTIGRGDPAVSTLRIVDDGGHELPAGQEGEVWARGPFTPMCYLGASDLDRRYRTEDGWVRTGDLGVKDSQGYLSIIGRLKDVIIRGGYNISPRETEEHILAHPDVAMVACVGVPDDRLGERIAAVLVLKNGAEPPTVKSLGQFLLARGLAKTKLPELIVIREKLPLNPTGKVLKRVLKEQLAAS